MYAVVISHKHSLHWGISISDIASESSVRVWNIALASSQGMPIDYVLLFSERPVMEISDSSTLLYSGSNHREERNEETKKR